MTRDHVDTEEERRERARKRSERLGVRAVDASGKVVLDHGPSLDPLLPSRTPEDSERNFQALFALIECFYPNEPMDRTKVVLVRKD